MQLIRRAYMTTQVLSSPRRRLSVGRGRRLVSVLPVDEPFPDTSSADKSSDVLSGCVVSDVNVPRYVSAALVPTVCSLT